MPHDTLVVKVVRLPFAQPSHRASSFLKEPQCDQLNARTEPRQFGALKPALDDQKYLLCKLAMFSWYHESKSLRQYEAVS